LHFRDVAKLHGSLDNVSAYCFENELGKLKKMVKSSHRAIISLVRGVHKRQAAEQGTLLTVPDLIIKCKAPNNVYVDVENDGACYQVTEADNDVVRCILFTKKEPFFVRPVSSAMFGCFTVKTNFYTYVTRTRDEVYKYRRAMRVDLAKLEGLDLPENQDVSVFMAMLHDQHNSLY